MALEDKNPMQGVSGPGAFSKRTDLKPQSAYYGEGVETASIQSGAPLAKTPDVRGATNTAVQSAAQDALTPLFAPSQRPTEPITTGIDIGPGAGSNALMMQSQFAQAKLSDTLAQMLPYDQTGEIAILYQRALSRGM